MIAAAAGIVGKGGAGKYLTVLLQREVYGISVLQVREIIRQQRITPLHHLPDFVKGVINLRGRVVPVIDLRVKLGLEAAFHERTCIVVCQLQPGAAPGVQVGLVVDSVDDVVTLTEEDIQPVPEFGVQLSRAGLLGMARTNDGVKTLLDLERLLAGDLSGERSDATEPSAGRIGGRAIAGPSRKD